MNQEQPIVDSPPSGDLAAPQPNAALASVAHWCILGGVFVPFAGLIGPLVLMLTKGKEDSFVLENAKEALNLFICTFIVSIIFVMLIFVVVGIFLLIALGICLLIFPIIAAIQTMGSTMDTPIYRYPMIFRLVK